MQAEVMTMASAPNQREPDRMTLAISSPMPIVARIWVSRKKAESPLPMLPIITQRTMTPTMTAKISEVCWSRFWAIRR